MKSRSHLIKELIKLPPSPLPDGRMPRDGVNDCIVITEGGMFYFTNILVTSWMLKYLEKYSVKVWKSWARRKRGGIDRYGKVLMEISQHMWEYRPWSNKTVIPGHGVHTQYLREITEADLPAIREEKVMQLI